MSQQAPSVDRPIGITHVLNGVARSLKDVPFPRMLTWEDGRITSDRYAFHTNSPAAVTMPKEWAQVLHQWSYTSIDDFGRLHTPREIVTQGYVFTLPGDPARPITPHLLNWLREAERDHQRVLCLVAEATIRSMSDIDVRWYGSPLIPTVVRFMEWFRHHSTYTEATLKLTLHHLRHWLSAVGPEILAVPEDPIAWSYAFGRAAKPRHSIEEFWTERWAPWVMSNLGIELPNLPGLPEDVIIAHDSIFVPKGAAFWTEEMIEAADRDPHHAKLLAWASADGRVPVIPRSTPILPRFAGGLVPLSNRKADRDLLLTPWSFADEVAEIKARGMWWDGPRMLLHYPGGGSLHREGPQVVDKRKVAHIGRPALGTLVQLAGAPPDEETEFVLVRVPKAIAARVLAFAEAQLTPHAALPEPAPAPAQVTETPPPRRREPKAPRASAAPPKAITTTAPAAPPVEAPVAPAPPAPAALPVAPAPDPEPPPTDEVVYPEELPAHLAIAWGWDRKRWLAFYRRQPDVPNPYVIERTTPPNHPRFHNGFKVPPEWLPKMSKLWQTTGIVTAPDLEIPGLAAYQGVYWTDEGIDEWEKAMAGEDDYDGPE